MIRTKGRNPFNYNGRSFVWYVADETQLRIASIDKRFVIMFELIGNRPLMAVSGYEFPGILPSLPLPIWIVPPQFNQMVGGALVREILNWCFSPSHEIVLYEGPPKTTVQRAWGSLESTRSIK